MFGDTGFSYTLRGAALTELGRKEVAAAREILARGTSAHRQLAAYQAALARGADAEEALGAVVDMLIEETVEGL